MQQIKIQDIQLNQKNLKFKHAPWNIRGILILKHCHESEFQFQIELAFSLAMYLEDKRSTHRLTLPQFSSLSFP